MPLSGYATAEGKAGTKIEGFMPIGGELDGKIKGMRATDSGELIMATLDFFDTVVEQNNMIIHLLSNIADLQEAEVGEI